MFWFLFWSLVWIVADIIAFFPNTTSRLANILNIEYGINAVVSLGLITLFYLVFRLYLKTEDQTRQFTEFVRKQALEGKDKSEESYAKILERTRGKWKANESKIIK